MRLKVAANVACFRVNGSLLFFSLEMKEGLILPVFLSIPPDFLAFLVKVPCRIVPAALPLALQPPCMMITSLDQF